MSKKESNSKQKSNFKPKMNSWALIEAKETRTLGDYLAVVEKVAPDSAAARILRGKAESARGGLNAVVEADHTQMMYLIANNIENLLETVESILDRRALSRGGGESSDGA